MHAWICFGAVLFTVASATAEEVEMVTLPPPQTTGGMPLMQALQARHSSREFSGRALEPQQLANLLWAAAGMNRVDSGKRTAPSAHDWREVDIYVAKASGTYLYDATAHVLHRVLKTDVRARTGSQEFVASAPLNLVYVADRRRMQDATDEDKDRYAAADTGFIAQNVYLYCASAGLNTVVRGLLDRKALADALKLAPQQRVILAQSVGYPL
ncbi:MAG: nitroreductase family protein [Gammaproteobacteria bacterium]|nr:nitroreductase family protein [Gammaproteobacteria bacterium]